LDFGFGFSGSGITTVFGSGLWTRFSTDSGFGKLLVFARTFWTFVFKGTGSIGFLRIWISGFGFQDLDYNGFSDLDFGFGFSGSGLLQSGLQSENIVRVFFGVRVSRYVKESGG
jgi:hypothetical protein